jgi:hypothetical protein
MVEKDAHAPEGANVPSGARRYAAAAAAVRQARCAPSARPVSWEASLWERRIRCHELDRHIYVDERFLDLTPIEYGLFWVLLRHTLQSLTGLAPAGGGCSMLDRYLEQVGIVPTARLLQVMTGDVGSLIASWPEWMSDHRNEVRPPTARAVAAPRARACLTSHLDRLRSKLRCHGLDVGTILLCGRSAQGYMLFPVDDA